jgi:hypothetical protein
MNDGLRYNDFCALGIDPGMTTGMALLRYREGLLIRAGVYQCNNEAAPGLLRYLLGTAGEYVVCQTERYARGPRSVRVTGPGGGITARLMAELDTIARQSGPETEARIRSAGEVKPWATDDRLERAGLLVLVPKQPDGKDACRHALYTACHDAGLPDPLSRRARPQLRES